MRLDSRLVELVRTCTPLASPIRPCPALFRAPTLSVQGRISRLCVPDWSPDAGTGGEEQKTQGHDSALIATDTRLESRPLAAEKFPESPDYQKCDQKVAHWEVRTWLPYKRNRCASNSARSTGSSRTNRNSPVTMTPRKFAGSVRTCWLKDSSKPSVPLTTVE